MFTFRHLLSAAILAGFAGMAVAQTSVRTDRLINLSSRSRIDAGQNELIAGFVIAGTAPKPVLLRAVGPALSSFAVSDGFAQPRLRLYDGQGRFLREVFGWGGDSSLASLFARVGAFSFAANSADAALVTTLAPGTYTMEVSGVSGAGTVLAEIYDASDATVPVAERLVNISTRGPVAVNNPLTGGFVVTGNTAKRVLVRGVGPALAAYRIATPLADPRVRVYRGSTVVGENDNWSADAAATTVVAAAAQATGAFALTSGSKDAAMILTLDAGAYTVQVSSVDGSAGIALVEIYEVP